MILDLLLLRIDGVQLISRWYRVKEFLFLKTLNILSVLLGLGPLVAETNSGPAILKMVPCSGIQYKSSRYSLRYLDLGPLVAEERPGPAIA